MKLQDIDIDDDAPEDLVQFIKHLEENLDPDDEYECDVWLETIHLDEVDELPGDQISMRGGEPNREDMGVRVYIGFVDNSDAPTRRLKELTRSFFDSTEVIENGRFDGGVGECERFVFPSAK